jgi:Retrotransposon gag protein/Zinc knuckle
MPDTGSASGETSEGRAYPLRSRGETMADDSRSADPLATILKELRLMKKEMAANKAEFDQKLVDLTQEIRASTESDTASTARPHIAEAQQTIVQPTVVTMAGAAVAQPVAEMPQTGGSGDSPGGNGGNVPHSQMSAETVQGRNEVGNSRQHFATLRPEAPNTFTGKPVDLEDWLEAVHIYLALYGQTDDKIMYMVVNQFLSADVKTWVKTLHLDSWVRLQKEMIAYYVDPLEEDRAWNSLNKLQQTGSVKDYSEKFLQLIVKVGNNVTEKDKIRRYVEGLKDEVRTVIRVGMVDGRYTLFAQVKSAAEALDFELWRSRRKTNPAGSSTTWHATKPTTGASSSSAANHHKTGRYPVPLNTMRNANKLSKEDTERYRSEKLCFGCGKSGHMARACPSKGKDRREAHEEN